MNSIKEMSMSAKTNGILAQELEKVLAPSPKSLRKREANLYDELTGSLSNSLVLFGAGGLGRKILHGLEKIGIKPLAFTDNNIHLHGQKVDGVPVLSPAQSAQEFGEKAVFIITIYTESAPGGIEPITEKLSALGCKKVISFAPLYWKYPDMFLPHYVYDLPHKVVEAADTIKLVAELFDDPTSQKEYLDQIRWRLNPQFTPTTTQAAHQIYFPPDLFKLNEREVFVDCGAFNGDTVQSFIQQSKGKFKKLLAFEPDLVNYKRLNELVVSLPPDLLDASKPRTWL